MKHMTVRFCLALGALLVAAAPALSQEQPLGRPVEDAAVAGPGAACPTVDPADGTPIEIRFGGMLVRAQVVDAAARGRSDEAGGGAGYASDDGANVRVRLVGCEERASSDGAVADENRVAGDASLLSLLHDLRVGLELGPSDDGRCFRARFSLSDEGDAGAAGAGPAAVREEPVALELCGLPFLPRN